MTDPLNDILNNIPPERIEEFKKKYNQVAPDTLQVLAFMAETIVLVKTMSVSALEKIAEKHKNQDLGMASMTFAMAMKLYGELLMTEFSGRDEPSAHELWLIRMLKRIIENDYIEEIEKETKAKFDAELPEEMR